MVKRNRRRLFVVEGSGRFPYDMLRYDQCWPRDQTASSMLTNESEGAHRRRVVLVSDWVEAPTIKRWESFLWRVVESGYEQ